MQENSRSRFKELCREKNQFSCPLLLMSCIYITETTTKDSQQRLHLHVKAEHSLATNSGCLPCKTPSATQTQLNQNAYFWRSMLRSTSSRVLMIHIWLK